MTKPEILGSLRSTYTRVVCMVCEEKGIEYTLTETMLGAPELAAIHPFGRMPALRHGEVALCESKAIATWLDRVFPAPFVFPSEPLAAALCEQWVSLINTTVDRTVIRTYLTIYLSAMAAGRPPDRAAIEAVMPEVRQQLGVLDRAVARTGHLVGDSFTYADINVMPILHRLQQAPEGAAAMAEMSALRAYYARHAGRPSFERTTPPPGPPKRAPQR